jgi:alkylated DNA repair dioxygenase AlkB
MSVAFQPSLFGAPDTAPDAAPGIMGDSPADIAPGPLTGLTRTSLGRGAWIDVLPGWMTGADDLFAALVREIPWRAERREMYDRVVDVPRLVHTYGVGEQLPHPALVQARDLLSRHYLPDLGEPFVTAGCCFYRDGRDSVAWHGDRIGRARSHDTMVAIVSLGSPRKLLLRPQGGSVEHTHPLGHGDLLVMGGSCQRTWEHAVPKTSRPVGPRISVQFRPRNVF